MRHHKIRGVVYAVCWAFLAWVPSKAADEGSQFFNTLKTSKHDAFLLRLGTGALSEEVLQKIEKMLKDPQLVTDAGGKIRFYLLDRNDKDLLTQDLEEKYFFDSIPVGILVDEDGRPVGRTIVTDDRRDTLVREIRRMRDIKEIRDKAFAESAKSEKGFSVQLLDKGLDLLPKNELGKYYQKEVKQILDGDDPGLTKKYQTILHAEGDRSLLEAALERLRRKISAGTMDLPAIINTLNEEMSREGLSKEVKQKFEMHKFRYFATAKQYEKALASLDEAFKLAPESPFAEKIEGFRDRIRKAKNLQEKNPEEPVQGVPTK